MKLLIGLGFRLGFVPPFFFYLLFFHFPFSRACPRSPFLKYINRKGNFAINASNQRLRKRFSDLLSSFILINNKSFNDESSIRVCKEVNLPILLSLFASYLHVVRWNLVYHGHPWLPGSPIRKKKSLIRNLNELL